MKTIRSSHWLSLALIASVISCGGSDDKDDGGSDTGEEADADIPPPPDTDTDTDADPETAELHGTVVYDDGSPAAGATVRMCSMYCITKEADESGNFAFEALAGDYYAFDLETHAVEDHATLLTFLEIAQEEVRTLDMPVVLPQYTHSSNLTSSAEITIAANLIIDADPSGYSAPLGSTDDTPSVAGVSMEPGTAGLPLESTQGQVYAMWYLGTWNAEIEPAWSFRTTEDSGLEPGTSFNILAGDYLNLTWIDGGTATVQNDGTIASDSGSGIPMLSTLVLTQ